VRRPSAAERVRAVAPGQNVLTATSWQGCGCGFWYESRAELAAIPEGEPARATAIDWQENGRGSVTALRDYLWEACRVVGSVRVYVTWAGEEGCPPQSEMVVTPNAFDGDGFRFRTYEVFTVVCSTSRRAEPSAAPDPAS
jgi:hypothetical protein